jgi:hypothetical protein
MEDAFLLFNISRPRRLIELSKLTQTTSRTLAENTQSFAAAHQIGGPERTLEDGKLEMVAKVAHQLESYALLVGNVVTDQV